MANFTAVTICSAPLHVHTFQLPSATTHLIIHTPQGFSPTLGFTITTAITRLNNHDYLVYVVRQSAPRRGSNHKSPHCLHVVLFSCCVTNGLCTIPKPTLIASWHRWRRGSTNSRFLAYAFIAWCVNCYSPLEDNQHDFFRMLSCHNLRVTGLTETLPWQMLGFRIRCA